MEFFIARFLTPFILFRFSPRSFAKFLSDDVIFVASIICLMIFDIRTDVDNICRTCICTGSLHKSFVSLASPSSKSAVVRSCFLFKSRASFACLNIELENMIAGLEPCWKISSRIIGCDTIIITVSSEYPICSKAHVTSAVSGLWYNLASTGSFALSTAAARSPPIFRMMLCPVSSCMSPSLVRIALPSIVKPYFSTNSSVSVHGADCITAWNALWRA